MDVKLNRLDPHIPDPIESRRRAAGRLVRIAYATIVFGILGFFIVYFGAPLVFLRGPGTVSSPRHVISLPYVVQVNRIEVTPGNTIRPGDEVAHVRSPEHDNIVATYMRALADVASRRAELRIKARVAQDSLDAARAYQRLTEQVANEIKDSSAASLAYQLEIFRERALANKTVVSQEAEIAESITQLVGLDALSEKLTASLNDVERDFAGGRVLAPVAGIVSTNLAYKGQSLLAGNPIAEILDPTEVFVDWYIPNERWVDPQVGQEVFVVFGKRRISGKIAEILPVSTVYAGAQQSFGRDRAATQIARIHFYAGAQSPPLNTTVYIHMHYTALAARVANALVEMLGLR